MLRLLTLALCYALLPTAVAQAQWPTDPASVQVRLPDLAYVGTSPGRTSKLDLQLRLEAGAPELVGATASVDLYADSRLSFPISVGLHHIFSSEDRRHRMFVARIGIRYRFLDVVVLGTSGGFVMRHYKNAGLSYHYTIGGRKQWVTMAWGLELGAAHRWRKVGISVLFRPSMESLGLWTLPTVASVAWFPGGGYFAVTISGYVGYTTGWEVFFGGAALGFGFKI